MKTKPPQNSPWGWRDFYSFSDKLIELGSLDKQCRFIQSTLKKQLGLQTHLWLSEIFHPLPGEKIPTCVEYGQPNTLVKRSISTQGIAYAISADKNNIAALPLYSQERLIGALELKFGDKKKPDQKELDFLNGFSSHCAMALLLTRQNAVKEWRYEQLSLLRQVNLKIARQRKDTSIFKNIVNLIQTTFHFYFVGLYTFDVQTQKLIYQYSAAAEVNEERLKDSVLPGEIPLGKGLVGKSAQLKKEIVSQDVRKASDYREIIGLLDTKSEATFPLLIDDRLLGILDVQTNQREGFHENDLVVLRILADNVAAAIDGTQLIEVISQRAEQLAAVTEVSRLLASILDVDELLNQVVSIISQKFGYPFVHCFVIDRRCNRLNFASGTGMEKLNPEGHGFGYTLDDPKGLVPLAARQQKTLVANDVSKEPGYKANELPPVQTRSEMAIPLLYGGELLGVLDFQSENINAFHSEDQFILEALAGSISIALRNANLYRTERWRNQVAESFREIAGLFSSQFTLDIIFEAILKELMRNLPSDAAAVWLLESDVENIEAGLKAAAVLGADPAEVQKKASRNEVLLTWLMQALASEMPVIKRVKDPYEPLGNLLRLPKQYSAIAAPIWMNDQVLGLIVLVNREENSFGDSATSMLSTFAGYTSIAIQNSQLYSDSVEQAFVSSVMLQVAQTVQSAEGIEELFGTIARVTPLMIGVDSCAFYLLDKFSERLNLMAYEGFKGESEEWLLHWTDSSDGKKAFDRIRKFNQPLPVLHVNNGNYSEKDRTGFVLLPLYAGNEFLGAFLAEHEPAAETSFSPQADDDQQLNVLQGIARQTAVAVQNILLKENGQSEGYITAALLQIAQTVVSSNDLQETFETIAATLPYLVGVETVLIYDFNEEDRIFHLRGYYSEKWNSTLETMSKLIKPGENQLLDEMMDERQILLFPLGNDSPSSWQGLNSQASKKTLRELNTFPNILFGIPLVVRHKIYGAMLVSENSQNIAFRAKRLEILQDVGQQLAMAVQSDRLTNQMVDNERMKREMQLANEIQRTFLPKSLPAITGWEVDVLWRPARIVGGDFYDAFLLPDGRLGLVIADVSDKGIPAALYMTVTRTLVHASAMDGESPAKVLMQANKLLMENLEEGLITTVFYAVIDPKSGEMVYCNAGHNRPAWVRPNKREVTWLRKGGTALGVFADIELVNSSVPIQKGDSLVLYTDGVSEARDQNDKLFGVKRLRNFLQNHFGTGASNLLKGLDKELAEFRQNQPQSDDITILAVRKI